MRFKQTISDIALFIKLVFTINVSEPFMLGWKFKNPLSTVQLIQARGHSGGGTSHLGVLGIIAAGVGGTFGFLFLLIIGGQIGGSSGIYGNLPASNISAITGNIGKAVVTGSNFVVLIYLGAGVAIAAAMIFLALTVFRHR